MSNQIGKLVTAFVMLFVLGSCMGHSHEESPPVIHFLNSPEMEALGLPFSQAQADLDR